MEASNEEIKSNVSKTSKVPTKSPIKSWAGSDRQTDRSSSCCNIIKSQVRFQAVSSLQQSILWDNGLVD